MNILYPPIKKETLVTQFTVEVENVKLFKSASISAILYDENGTQVDFRRFTLDGDDYVSWAEDDKYIVNYVKMKLQGRSSLKSIPLEVGGVLKGALPHDLNEESKYQPDDQLISEPEFSSK